MRGLLDQTCVDSSATSAIHTASWRDRSRRRRTRRRSSWSPSTRTRWRSAGIARMIAGQSPDPPGEPRDDRTPLSARPHRRLPRRPGAAAPRRRDAAALDRAARALSRAPDRPPRALGRAGARTARWSRAATARAGRRRLAARSPTRRCSSARSASRRRSSRAGCRPNGRSRSCPTTTSSTWRLALGAMWAGVPYAPVSPAYSLLSQDFAKLRHIAAADARAGVRQRRGVRAGDRARCSAPTSRWCSADGTLDGRATTPFADAAGHPARRRQSTRRTRRSGPDTIAKFLFTSGSTKDPKGVINTQRMLCANQQMLRQAFAFLADEPPVLVDWLPWNHTFGGNHNVGIALYNGGTLYIDEGKPTPRASRRRCATCARSRRPSTSTCPRASRRSPPRWNTTPCCASRCFAACRPSCSPAPGLSQAVWDQLDRHAEAEVGERIAHDHRPGHDRDRAVVHLRAARRAVRSGHIGLPCPGRRGEAGARRRHAATRPRCASAART